MSNEYISQEKLNTLKVELEFLKTTRRKELAENLQKGETSKYLIPGQIGDSQK